MLMHKFTKREKIVLVVLVIALLIGVYFLMIHYPVKKRLEEIAAEKIATEDEIEIANIVLMNYRRMQNELDEIFAMPEDEITVMPEYDNVEVLTTYLYTIFPLGSDYNLRYDNVKFEGNIAVRSISFSFTADSYETAHTKLELLTGTGYRCLMQNLTIAPTDGDVESDELRVSGSIIFYELVV